MIFSMIFKKKILMIIICSICVLYQYNNTQVNNSQERENPIRSSLDE